MIFPEHMEFRYSITPERKECFTLYSKTLGQRRTILEKTQDVGQCLIDLYDTDFYDAYCVLSEIQKMVRAYKTKPHGKGSWSWRCRFARCIPSLGCWSRN